MNCLEFRRQLLIDPLHLDEAAAGHEAECTSCAAHAREVRAQEVKLRALLMEVTPPEGMADRIGVPFTKVLLSEGTLRET